jgi:hypothetical protein
LVFADRAKVVGRPLFGVWRGIVIKQQLKMREIGSAITAHCILRRFDRKIGRTAWCLKLWKRAGVQFVGQRIPQRMV